ncbi:hypothetical protein B7494_g1751 [Chlorociboria aeruginascens]|nr:hypothetical protein B7494_g1751 [Chlorociboria aeruginascens]
MEAAGALVAISSPLERLYPLRMVIPRDDITRYHQISSVGAESAGACLLVGGASRYKQIAYVQRIIRRFINPIYPPYRRGPTRMETVTVQSSPSPFTIRKATEEDIPPLRLLIEASVHGLHGQHYKPDQIAKALESVYGIDTHLIQDGHYFVVTSGPLIVGCGGWSHRLTLYGGDQFAARNDTFLDPKTDAAKIRAFFVHPDWIRRGIAGMVLKVCEDAARGAGFARAEMGATLSGVPFYKKMGYVEGVRADASIGDGLLLEIFDRVTPLNLLPPSQNATTTRLHVQPSLLSITNPQLDSAIEQTNSSFRNMAPSSSVISDALIEAVDTVFHSNERDNLTVKLIRTRVEGQLGLDKDFFTQSEWKEKSKQLIKDEVNRLMSEDETAEPTPPPVKIKPDPVKMESKKSITPVKKGIKRSSTGGEKKPPKKRQKKGETPEEEPSQLSAKETPVSDFSEVPKPRKAKSTSRAQVKRQAKKKAKVESENEDDVSDFGGKTGSSEDEPAPKRKSKSIPRTPIKRRTKTKAKVESEDEDDLSDFGGKAEESDAKPTPKSKSKPKKGTPIKRQPKNETKIESIEEDEDLGDAPYKVKDEDSDAKPTPKKKTQEESDEKDPSPVKHRPSTKLTSDLEDESNSTKQRNLDLPNSFKTKSTRSSALKDEDDEEKQDIKANDSDSSEMSVLIDASPPKRGRPKSGSSLSSKPAKSSSSIPAKVPKAKAPPKDLSAAEQQLKTLQSHLLRCGVRKIWAFELKQYGDDNSAKIKHLQNILKEIGMVGRFSEARAREIKDQRELQADLEAVKEGERKWGMESEMARPRRGAVGKRVVVDSEDGDEDESSEEKKKKILKGREALAFLGDEESSDDD